VADSPADLPRLLARLRAGDESAWIEFIDRYAHLMLQAARAVERDLDAASDAFVFAAERLRERRSARLQSYDPARPGSFENWLRAVALNLARDARRQRLGRLRPLAISHRLAPLEQRVLRLRYELGLTFDQLLTALTAEFPGLTEARLVEAETTIARQLSAGQRWRLLTRRPQIEPLSNARDSDAGDGDHLLSDAPNAEWLALRRESRAAVVSAIRRLSPDDQLLVRLHVERGVTLDALARMFELPNPQAAHRRLRAIIAHLKELLTNET